MSVKSPLRILLLEDDAGDAELIREFLDADGLAFTIIRTQTRAEFIAALHEESIDLILADHKLPSFDGFSALKLAQGARPDLPFIIVSGTLGEELAIEALKIGATDYVLKTGLSKLAGVVQRALRESDERAERKRAEQTLREQANLLNLTHDAIFVHDMKGVITYWNRGAAALYGWTIDEARGEVASELLKTVVPVPFELKDGRWQGELMRTTKDGTHVVVASRWSLQRDDKGAAIAILETNNDITEQKRAEEAARRSARELRDVIESIPAIAWSGLPDGSNTFVNSRWVEYTGIPLEQAIGLGWQTAVHPEDVQRYMDKVHACRTAGEPYEDEVRFRRADGEYRWHLGRAQPLRDDTGEILKWYGVLTDIEDRKRAEILLAGEKRLLEMVAKGESLGEILDGLCRLVEENAEDVLASVLLLEGNRLRHGGAPSLPKTYTNAIDGGVIGPAAGSCGTAAYLGRRVIVEDIASDPLWADYRDAALSHGLRACWSTPIFSSNGKVIATFAQYYREPRSPSRREQEIIEQITHLARVAIEHKLTQDQLQRSEAYLAEAQRLSHTGSFGWDVSSDQLYWSEETFRIFECERNHQPTVDFGLQRTHPEDRAMVRQIVDRARQDRRDLDFEHRLLMPDGRIKHVHIVGHPAFDQIGRFVEFVGTIMDVTERRRAEEERQVIAHANRIATMGQLTASIAHEVNQPIAAVVTNAEAALRWIDAKPANLREVREALGRIVTDGRRAGDVIGRIRAMIAKAPPRKIRLDINNVIQEVIALARSEIHRNGVALRTQLASDMQLVKGDRVQLQQVMINLILNAVEALGAIGEGPRDLLIGSADGGAEGIHVAVRDSGPGLSPESMSRLFEAFYTTKPAGMGMGLAICRSIIEAHGGRLWATANQPRGAAFQFTLPAEESETPLAGLQRVHAS
jgi:PAS domain S-box-containing protein